MAKNLVGWGLGLVVAVSWVFLQLALVDADVGIGSAHELLVAVGLNTAEAL